MMIFVPLWVIGLVVGALFLAILGAVFGFWERDVTKGNALRSVAMAIFVFASTAIFIANLRWPS